jgi:hypothetical protein
LITSRSNSKGAQIYKWLAKINILVRNPLKSNNFAFYLLIFVSHLVRHNSWKNLFLTDSKWRNWFKMAASLELGITIAIANIFSVFLLHQVCVSDRNNLWNNLFSFQQKMAPPIKYDVSKWFFCHNFKSLQLFTCHIWNMREVLV